MTATPSNPTLRPFWVAISFVNFTAALPMIELDLRQVDGTSPHHAESIACHALLAEIGRDQAHIICALGKVAGADVPRLSMPPAAGSPAAPPPPGPDIMLSRSPAPAEREEKPPHTHTLAQARLEVAAVLRDLLQGVPVDVTLTAPTYRKLLAVLEQANFDATKAELWKVAATLLGRVVGETQPLKESDGRAVLAFLERATPESLDMLFPVVPFPEAG